MLRQSMIAAALAVVAVAAAGGSDAAPAATGDIPIFADPAASSNAPSAVPAPQAQHRAPVRHRTIVHHVYRYQPAPAAYYYGPPAYAPAAPVAALPAAAACLALSLLGGC